MVRIPSVSFVPFAFAATAAVAGASAKTSLYLSPAAHSSGAPISINAEEAHRVLSHHIGLPASAASAASESDSSAIWSHVLHSNKPGDVKVDQRTMVERLFDGHHHEQNRLLVLMHGAAHGDVIPNGLRATHSVERAPSSNSFDALFDSYMASLSQTLKSSDSPLSHLTGTFMHGFGANIEWLTTKLETTAAKWSKQSASFQSAAFSKLEDELRSAEALLAKLDTDNADATQHLSMQPLRFSGLQHVESAYGAESVEYAKAKQLVRAAIEQVTSLFQTRSEEQGRAAAVAFVVTETDDAVVPHLAKRSTADLLAPFKRASELSHASALRADAFASKPSHLAKNLAATCFTSQSDLENATNQCSGHGNGVKTSKGGKPCWRCQCKPTEVRKGKKVYWAGAACEKKDVSAEFMLLASSVIMLVLISAGSVYLLFAQGSEELPGTLASVTISLK